jgi:hypothetical protein
MAHPHHSLSARLPVEHGMQQEISPALGSVRTSHSQSSRSVELVARSLGSDVSEILDKNVEDDTHLDSRPVPDHLSGTTS